VATTPLNTNYFRMSAIYLSTYSTYIVAVEAF
jgi:hypothetical protein